MVYLHYSNPISLSECTFDVYIGRQYEKFRFSKEKDSTNVFLIISHKFILTARYIGMFPSFLSNLFYGTEALLILFDKEWW